MAAYGSDAEVLLKAIELPLSELEQSKVFKIIRANSLSLLFNAARNRSRPTRSRKRDRYARYGRMAEHSAAFSNSGAFSAVQTESLCIAGRRKQDLSMGGIVLEWAGTGEGMANEPVPLSPLGDLTGRRESDSADVLPK